MKPFHLESRMTTLRGVFYPTGYMVLMFPTAADAREAERRLLAGGNNGEDIHYMSPGCILDELAGMVDDPDAMPSFGTDAATVRHFVELAREGQHGLMVKCAAAGECERDMTLLAGMPITFGQKYRRLVIEDLVQ